MVRQEADRWEQEAPILGLRHGCGDRSRGGATGGESPTDRARRSPRARQPQWPTREAATPGLGATGRFAGRQRDRRGGTAPGGRSLLHRCGVRRREVDGIAQLSAGERHEHRWQETRRASPLERLGRRSIHGSGGVLPWPEMVNCFEFRGQKLAALYYTGQVQRASRVAQA